jgi:glycerol-3-phosphate acyltransferase PlsY
MEALFIIIGYLSGSIPFGLLLTKFSGYGDVRKIGSGNIGATNVLRTGNKKLALMTLLLDGGKGAVIMLIAKAAQCPPDIVLLVGLFSVLGHMFPIWLKFKGGKGVATAIGVVFAFQPLVGLLISCTWLLTAYLSRISSLSALVSMAFLPIYTTFFIGADHFTVITLCFLSCLIFVKHKENIIRLYRKQEPRFDKKE